MTILHCTENDCIKEQCGPNVPFLCIDKSPGAPYGGCFSLDDTKRLSNLDFCNTSVCDKYDYETPACNRNICMRHKCPDSAPYVCYNDSPYGENWACYSSELIAKQGCNPAYSSQQLCDASKCHSPTPGPKPGPAPHKFCPSNCVIPVDSCNRFTAYDAYHQLANCACGYESPGWADPSMCELKNVGGTIYCGRSEEPRPPDSKDCDYLDRCNNRGRWIAGASGSCIGCSENTTGTFCDRCIQGTHCDQPQMGDLCPYPARCV